LRRVPHQPALGQPEHENLCQVDDEKGSASKRKHFDNGKGLAHRCLARPASHFGPFTVFDLDAFGPALREAQGRAKLYRVIFRTCKPDFF
jgi:hypothetical protein